jgi:hypothetical protein
VAVKRKKSGGSGLKITDSDLKRLKDEGAEAVDYYRTSGLRLVRSQATDMAFSGAIPIFGLLFLKWSPMTMLVYLVVDAVIAVLSDLIRMTIAGRWVKASHVRDHEAGQLLLIADGLEDGTGDRADNGQAPKPGMILFFGIVATLFLVPVVAAATEKTGLAPIRAVVEEDWFPWIVGLDAAWHFLSALVQSVRIRWTPPGESMIFLRSGGVAVLYCGLLVLIWLPLNWGANGLLVMFFVLYFFRLAFGLFAYFWTPKAVANLRRRVETSDFSIRKKPSPSP